MLAVSVWICKASAVESWGMPDSIWTLEFEWNYALEPKYEIVVLIDGAKLIMLRSSVDRKSVV